MSTQFSPVRRRSAAVILALMTVALLVVPTSAALAASPAGPSAQPAAARPAIVPIVHQAELRGEACRGVRPEGEAGYMAVPGRGGRLDVRISQVLCHERETLVVSVSGSAVGRIAIQPGGRGVAAFTTVDDDHFPRVHAGDRIALTTETGELVAGGIFR